MLKPTLIGLAAALALAGCARGIQPGGAHPDITFTVPTAPQAVYRRAVQYVQVCHETSERRVGVHYVGTRVLEAQGHRQELRVHPSTRPREALEIIVVTPAGQGDAQVHATVLGEREWDRAELQALRASLLSATPVCRAL